MKKTVADFVDQWGILDKHNRPDGGDSAHREGMFWTLCGLMDSSHMIYWLSEAKRWLNDFEPIMDKLQPHPGVILRHPNPNYDASDWDRMSRDQLIPIIMACGIWSQKHLKRCAWGHLKRGFLFTNNTRQNGATKHNHGTGNYSYAWKLPDLTGPEIWALYIRAFNAWYLYPLLLLFDLETLIGSIIWRFWPKNNIAINHSLVCAYSNRYLPTPIIMLARWIMPQSKLLILINEHFRDFRHGSIVMDMEFFGDMFYDVEKRRSV